MQVLAGLLVAAIGWPGATVTNISPSAGTPRGGSLVRIDGSGFEPPVRVWFRTNEAEAEAFVASTTYTTIDVFTPPVAAAGPADVIVASRAGTPHESRATATGVWRYGIVQPSLSVISPRNAPLRGETYVTIFGEGFERPVSVFFGTAQASVVEVRPTTIRVIVPPAQGPGRVDVRVENVIDGTSAVLPDALEYVDPPRIDSVVPGRGPSTGGTAIRIQGGPFRQPEYLAIGNVPLHILAATESEIAAMTPPLGSVCDALTGPILVIEASGAEASGASFTYEPVAEAPSIAATGSMVTEPGGEVEVVLAREGNVQFYAGTELLEVVSRTGSTYRLRAPARSGFPLRPCITEGISGTRLGVSSRDLHIVDLDTGCRTNKADTLWLRPPQPGVCTLPPHAIVNAGCVRFPRGTTTRALTIANRGVAGTSKLEITGAMASGPFSIAPAAATIAAGESATFTVTYEEGVVRAGEAVFTTNDPDRPLLRVCLTAPARIRD